MQTADLVGLEPTIVSRDCPATSIGTRSGASTHSERNGQQNGRRQTRGRADKALVWWRCSRSGSAIADTVQRRGSLRVPPAVGTQDPDSGARRMRDFRPRTQTRTDGQGCAAMRPPFPPANSRLGQSRWRSPLPTVGPYSDRGALRTPVDCNGPSALMRSLVAPFNRSRTGRMRRS